MHLCRKLLKEGYIVNGIDNMNDYYDLSLKKGSIKFCLIMINSHLIKLI